MCFFFELRSWNCWCHDMESETCNKRRMMQIFTTTIFVHVWVLQVSRKNPGEQNSWRKMVPNFNDPGPLDSSQRKIKKHTPPKFHGRNLKIMVSKRNLQTSRDFFSGSMLKFRGCTSGRRCWIMCFNVFNRAMERAIGVRFGAHWSTGEVY